MQKGGQSRDNKDIIPTNLKNIKNQFYSKNYI